MSLLQQQWQMCSKANTPAKLVIGVFRLPSWSLASACSTQVVGVILQRTQRALLCRAAHLYVRFAIGHGRLATSHLLAHFQ
jgi:hypothetical protein